ncbi:MAG: succinylglutamate desuccinylase/aspartoacylase family protein [Myxococcales bacterium]|nr:succinylglutamate desuccinylase/aspartoacylase family protein [Myxococcales bacterium]
MDNALGRPIRLPVLVARGARPGPVLGVTAAVHGDEVNGIPIIHQLFQKLDPRKLKGTVLAVAVVNVPAYEAHTRRAPYGFDLNHHFPGRADGNAIEVYAHTLLRKVFDRVDALVDLHTASRGRSNSLYVRADMTREPTARMAYLQRPQIILHNPASDGTLRGALDVPAITVEVGNPSRFQRDFIRRSVVGLRAVLGERGMMARRPVAMGEPPVLCASSHWIYTQEGGLLDVLVGLGDQIDQGQPIARLVDAFGDLRRSYEAPHAGIVIGRAVDPVAAAGARILHLGRLASAEDGFVAR